jgi:hypothetical protein
MVGAAVVPEPNTDSTPQLMVSPVVIVQDALLAAVQAVPAVGTVVLLAENWKTPLHPDAFWQATPEAVLVFASSPTKT